MKFPDDGPVYNTEVINDSSAEREERSAGKADAGSCTSADGSIIVSRTRRTCSRNISGGVCIVYFRRGYAMNRKNTLRNKKRGSMGGELIAYGNQLFLN